MVYVVVMNSCLDSSDVACHVQIAHVSISPDICDTLEGRMIAGRSKRCMQTLREELLSRSKSREAAARS